jgi:hypothetical protein
MSGMVMDKVDVNVIVDVEGSGRFLDVAAVSIRKIR